MRINLKRSFILSLAVLMLLINVVCINFTADAMAGRYSGYGEAVPYATKISTETVNYTKREYEVEALPYGVPAYMSTKDLTNSCGAVAGTIVVGYYDTIYEDLIPDYKTNLSNGKFKLIDKTYIPSVMSELYTLMRTNVDDVGVSRTDFLNGLRTFISNKGYTVGYSDVKSNNKISESYLLQAVNNSQPVVLFCNRVDLYSLSLITNSDIITCINISEIGHMVVGFGLYTVKYYNGDTLFRTDKYIEVVTGLSNSTVNYMKLDSTSWCDAAYAVAVN